MDAAPLFSVVVPTRGGRPEALRACLDSLAALDYPRDAFEIVVVADGVDPAPVDERPGVELTVVAQPSAGPAAARNRGAQIARGRYLAFTDDDCTVPADWLRKLEASLHGDDHAVGGRVLNAVTGNVYSETSCLLVHFLHRHYNGASGPARFATSNNLAIPAALFAELGGFDAGFVLAGGEDRDLSDRLARAGHLRFDSGIVVHHHHDLDLQGFVRQHFRYGRGAARFHAVRTGSARLEPLAFYRELFRSAERRPRIAALLALSQILTAAGYVYEKRIKR